MKVLKVIKTGRKNQYDLRTAIQNFYVLVGEKLALVHNSPAVFAGTDPRDGKFFVAKKGIFNKNPKVYKTPAEIDADTSGDLANKLKLSLEHLPSLGIRGVVQGDFLFDRSDLKVERIKGVRYITFHPNTIVYAIPFDSEAGKQIRKSKMGIVWHTSYSGNSFETMKASYGVDVHRFKDTPNVWSQDAFLRDLTNYTLSKKDTETVTKYLSDAGKIFNQIAGSTLRQLESNQELASHIETFNNSYVRAGNIIQDTGRHVRALIKWIEEKYQKEADKRKTGAGKSTQYKKRDAILSFFSKENMISLKKVFDLQKLLVFAKLKLINTLNKWKNVKTFVKTRNGFKAVGHEGYVAIDRLSGGALKIVDRMEFSYNNFSPDILKGWEH